MAGRDPKPEPVSISEWRRYVQRETRRMLQKQEEAVARGEAPAMPKDPTSGLPLPAQALEQPGPATPDSAHRVPHAAPDHAPRLSDVIARPEPQPQTAPPRPVRRDTADPAPRVLQLDDLAELDSDIQPLTPEIQAEIERERKSLLQQTAPRIAPHDEAALLRQAAAPLEATEVPRAEALPEAPAAVEFPTGTAALAMVPGVDDEYVEALPEMEAAAYVPVEAPLPAPTVVATAVEQTTLFDTEHIARREEEARRTRRPSPKQKREELIEELLDPVVSLEEAATILNVCKTTVRRYTNQGLLECIRTPGNQRRFKLSTILNFVEVKDVKGIGKRGRKPKKRDEASSDRGQA